MLEICGSAQGVRPIGGVVSQPDPVQSSAKIREPIGNGRCAFLPSRFHSRSHSRGSSIGPSALSTVARNNPQPPKHCDRRLVTPPALRKKRGQAAIASNCFRIRTYITPLPKCTRMCTYAKTGGGVIPPSSAGISRQRANHCGIRTYITPLPKCNRMCTYTKAGAGGSSPRKRVGFSRP